MSARRQISELLGQWLELTQAEGGAIQSSAWARLGEIQAAKSNLKKALNEALKHVGGLSSGPDGDSLRVEARRLISLEARNQDLLAAQRRKAGAERESLKKAHQNLRKVRQSYVGQRPTVWQEYS